MLEGLRKLPEKDVGWPLSIPTRQHGMKPTAAVNSDTGTAQVSVKLDDGASLMRSEPTGMTLLSWLSSTAPVVSPIAAGEGYRLPLDLILIIPTPTRREVRFRVSVRLPPHFTAQYLLLPCTAFPSSVVLHDAADLSPAGRCRLC